jgi:hypothetical protein
MHAAGQSTERERGIYFTIPPLQFSPKEHKINKRTL